MTTKNLAIDLITAISGMQMREGMKLDVIEEYQECFNGKAWPFNEPLVVFSDGESYWLADGFHRFEAAKRAKRGSVQCEIRTGSVHDAEDYAAGANGRHGLRRTNADKRKAVLWALNCDRHCNKSLRDIADLCLVGKSLVGSIKHELSLKDSGVDSGQVSLKDSQKPAGTVKTESIENENDFTPPDETEYEYIEKDENEPLEDGEIDCGPVEELPKKKPEKEPDCKYWLKVCIQHAERVIMHSDDAKAKRNNPQHGPLQGHIFKALACLKEWLKEC